MGFTCFFSYCHSHSKYKQTNYKSFQVVYLSCRLSLLSGENFALRADRTHYIVCLWELAELKAFVADCHLNCFPCLLLLPKSIILHKGENVEESTSTSMSF